MSPSIKLSNPTLLVSKAYINGAWVNATDGKVFTVENPATFETLAEMPDMTREQVRDSIDAAKAAMPAWSVLTAYQRQTYLVKLLAAMRENAEDLAIILTLENGKTLAESRGEILYGAGFLEWFAAEALRTYGHNVPSALPGTRNNIIKQPVGVCGLITPWNFPNAMITRKLAPALAAGCTVVIKAPAETPLSALAMCVLCEQVGIPKGVVNCVTVSKGVREADCGLEMCENPKISKISFTGSTAVGRLLMRQSSGTLKKLSMELGGNAPFIIFDDADIDSAVQGLIASKYRAGGQTCISANRIYVQDGIYSRFATLLTEKVNELVTGDPLQTTTNIGPMINRAGVDKVSRHVKDATSNGAKVLTGGAEESEKSGYYYKPTVMSEVTDACSVAKEETFGPLAALLRFSSEEEVLERANRSDVGLAGYVYTSDIGRLYRVSEALQVGMVAVNTGIISQPCIPFGGVKASGFGREGGKSGMDEYLVDKLITIKACL